MLEFETERLRVRRLCVADESLFCDLYTDAGTMQFIGEPLSSYRAARLFRKAVAYWQETPLQRAVLSIAERRSGRAIGICAISQFNALRTRAEVGMMLLTSALAQGYSSECLGQFVARTFAVFPIDAVWVQYSPGHSAAERLVVGLGFSPEVDLGSTEGFPARRIWSVHRPARPTTILISNQGEDNVECHRIS